jgi:acyl-CoA synthetase (AMP-forming)/AMP-acid ligase II
VYGSSELFALTAVWGRDLNTAQRARGGGSPVSEDVHVRVVDVDTGHPVGVTEPGELQFRGYNVLTEYLGRPDTLAKSLTPDGWFRTGDLGFLTGEGTDFVYLCRQGDALRLRGFLVEPGEIEQFLLSHPDVAAACVVGVAAQHGGDSAVGFVILREGAPTGEAELLDFCRARLAAFKVPRRINITDAFPLTAGTNGAKVLTAELRARAELQLETERR